MTQSATTESCTQKNVDFGSEAASVSNRKSKVSEEHEDRSMMHNAIHTVVTLYGPYAFGLASLMIIWLYIVQPQLELQALDFQQMQVVVSQMKDVNTSQESTAEVLLRTTASLEVVSATLERTAQKLVEVSQH